MTKPATYRITATHRSNGEEAILGRSKTLEGINRRLDRDAEMWSDLGWECFTVEDNSVGGQWTEMLLEDLRGRMKRREISRELFRNLEWSVAR